MEFKIGEYKVYSHHKGCRYGGRVMEIRPIEIDGDKYPHTAPDCWYWCDGKTWDVEKRIWEHCGTSSEKLKSEIQRLKNIMASLPDLKTPDIKNYKCDVCDRDGGRVCNSTIKPHVRTSESFDVDNNIYKTRKETGRKLLECQRELANILK